MEHHSGPPYASRQAGVGGVPTIDVDVPIDAVFSALYLIGAIANFTLLRHNLAKGHRFVLSGMIGGFCMARLATNIMRIVWACYPHNVRIAMAAGILNSAGIVLVYIIHLIFSFRLLQAAIPSPKVEKISAIVLKSFLGVVLLMLGGIITTVIQQFYTLDQHIRSIDRIVQGVASAIFCMVALIPFVLIILANIVRKQETFRPFGKENWKIQNALLLTTSVLVLIIAVFRLGTAWSAPRPVTDPAWFDAKWAFYCFGFMLEVLIIYTFLLARVDLHFHIEKAANIQDEEKATHANFYSVAADGTWRPIEAEVAHPERTYSPTESLESLHSHEAKK